LKNQHKTFDEYMILKEKHQKDIKNHAKEIINNERQKQLIEKKKEKKIN